MSADLNPPGLQDVLEFFLVEALLGRRSRRFLRGATIPTGPLAYRSRHAPMRLSELEKMLMLQAMGLGGWMYNGINPYSILGASGEPDVPGRRTIWPTRSSTPICPAGSVPSEPGRAAPKRADTARLEIRRARSATGSCGAQEERMKMYAAQAAK